MKLLILFFCLFYGPSLYANECEKAHGAIDFGSGTTKFYAALVNVCEKKIVKTLYEDRLALALNEAMEKTSDKTIPAAVLDEALPKIKKLLTEMQKFNPVRVDAVATSVFRVAKNGSSTAQRLAKELKIEVRVISQEEEAALGYWSARSQKDLNPVQNFIVWDIGGGSMQMYSQEKQKIHVFEGQMASVTYKNAVLQVMQFKDPKQAVSPNPFYKNISGSLQIAKNHAYGNVPKYFKDEAAKARWVGVGGVLSMSVQRQVNAQAGQFTQEQLLKTLQERSQLSDAQIQSEYRATDVTNLALVLGYMQALGITQVETVQSSLGQGLIFKNLR